MVEETCELKIKCDRRLNMISTCQTKLNIPVQIKIAGPEWYRARDRAKMMGWIIRANGQAFCPGCVKSTSHPFDPTKDQL
jgi:hypothetical protein